MTALIQLAREHRAINVNSTRRVIYFFPNLYFLLYFYPIPEIIVPRIPEIMVPARLAVPPAGFEDAGSAFCGFAAGFVSDTGIDD